MTDEPAEGLGNVTRKQWWTHAGIGFLVSMVGSITLSLVFYDLTSTQAGVVGLGLGILAAGKGVDAKTWGVWFRMGLSVLAVQIGVTFVLLFVFYALYS